MITFDHNADTIFDSLGVTIDDVMSYLKSLQDNEGNKPETIGDATLAIINGIRNGSAEAAAVLCMSINKQVVDKIKTFEDPIARLLLAELMALVMTYDKPSRLVEKLIDNIDNYQPIMRMLLMTFMTIEPTKETK